MAKEMFFQWGRSAHDSSSNTRTSSRIIRCGTIASNPRHRGYTRQGYPGSLKAKELAQSTKVS